jgi:pyroglutamyl-peptidase
MRILLTGFEPFGGSSVNPSEEIVRALERRSEVLQKGGIDLHTRVVPVEAARGPKAVIRAVDRIRPHAIVMLGESARASAITLERVFINLADYRIPDNAGVTLSNVSIAPRGTAAYFSTLPIDVLSEALRSANIPVEVSLSAGAYLCNHLAYVVLHHLAQRRGGARVPAGFIHVPRLRGQTERGSRESGRGMALESMVRAVETMLIALAKDRAAKGDRRTRAGSASRARRSRR